MHDLDQAKQEKHRTRRDETRRSLVRKNHPFSLQFASRFPSFLAPSLGDFARRLYLPSAGRGFGYATPKSAPCWAYQANILIHICCLLWFPSHENISLNLREKRERFALHRASQITDAFHFDPRLRRSLFCLLQPRTPAQQW